MSVAISWANKMQLAKCDIMVGFPISSHIYIMLCSSTAGLYTHSSNNYVLTCSLYPRPLSYYTNVHIQLVDVYMHMVYIHHHNTHHYLGVVVDCQTKMVKFRSIAAVTTCPKLEKRVSTFLITISDL